MAFQTPVTNTLTPTQEAIISQLTSVKNLLSLPDFRVKNIAKSKQLSTYDFLMKVAESAIGQSFIASSLNLFLSRLFDPTTSKLEEFIIKSIAKSLDKNNRHISPFMTNEQWLIQNVLPQMKKDFVLVKALLVKQIMSMMFGPAEQMSFDNKGNLTNNATQQRAMLNMAVCAENSVSLSNDEQTEGDLQYNLIQLKERLQTGNVVFTISCQDVKIKLPETIITSTNDLITNNTGGNTPINPAVLFTQLGTHVASETQRINTQQNANSVNKNFQQNLVDKILKLMSPALQPYLGTYFDAIVVGAKTAGGNLGTNIYTGADLANATNPSPCDLAGLSKKDPDAFANNSTFMTILINLIYSFLCSVVLQLLIIQIKKLIRNALAKKAASKAQRRFKKLNAIASQASAALDASGKAIEQAQMAENALGDIASIFNYENTV